MTVAVKSPVEPNAKPVVDDVDAPRPRRLREFPRSQPGARRRGGERARLVDLQARARQANLPNWRLPIPSLGNVPDKIIKKQRKTFGTLRDLLRVKSVGIIEEDKAKGHRQIRQADGRRLRRSRRRPIRARRRSTRR